MWSEHCGYKHSRRLLKTLPTEGPRLVLGPGRERGRGVGRRRAGVRVQGRVAQPPERGRAVRGRRDRRRRHPARHLRDRRAADRDPGLAALRRGRRRPPARATCSSARSPGIGHYGNSIGIATVGGEIYFEGPYEQNCLVNAMCARADRDRQADPQRRRGRREHRRAVRRAHGPRRDRRRVGAGLRRARRRPRTSARPCRSATRSPRRSCSSARSSCSTAGCWSRCRTSARRA